jgi:alginate O-acetyltransferase complex protein AlgI
MLLNSLDFAAFLAVVACGYHLSPIRWRCWYLLVSSYLFYFTWSVPFALLLLAVTLVAYVVAKRMATLSEERARRQMLTGGVAVLLLPLFALKYLSHLSLGLLHNPQGGAWISQLPSGVAAVGISYYTFKLISYVVDVYWQRIEPCHEFGSLAAFAAFFPQILSGPIQRAGDFLGQIQNLGATHPELIVSGLRLMLFGFFKKLVVADRLDVVVGPVFAHPHQWSGPVLALGSYLFAIQLYADFSGITDIAIGTGRVLGFHSPPNFNSPFYAENIQDFWRRWHMSLTSWLTDYVFMPLWMALRKWGQVGLAASLVINMAAVGVWHGAAWTFVVFGLIHATYMTGLSLTSRWRKRLLHQRPILQRMHRVVGPIITFNLVVASLIFFRAADLSDAWYILSHACEGILSGTAHLAHRSVEHGVWGLSHLRWTAGDIALVTGAALIMEIVHLLQRRKMTVSSPLLRWAGYFVLGFAILLWGESGSTQFIYVRF